MFLQELQNFVSNPRPCDDAYCGDELGYDIIETRNMLMLLSKQYCKLFGIYVIILDLSCWERTSSILPHKGKHARSYMHETKVIGFYSHIKILKESMQVFSKTIEFSISIEHVELWHF